MCAPPLSYPRGLSLSAPGAARFRRRLRLQSSTLNLEWNDLRSKAMLHPRPAKKLVRKSVSAALVALMVLAFAPAPPASRVAAQTAGGDPQSPNVPVIAPGS